MKRNQVLSLCALISFFLCISNGLASSDENVIKGEWYTTDKIALVKIYKTGELWNGKIIWLKEPIENDRKSPAYGKECVDFRNPDSGKRSRPILGIEILKNFKWNGKKFAGGTIYDPDLGKTYKCQIKFGDEDTLDVRGYIGVPVIGRTEVWIRNNSR